MLGGVYEGSTIDESGKVIANQTVNNKDVYILGALRRCVFDLKSNDYITKKKIISFLQHRSLDYEKEPIPDSILSEIQNKYPDDWNDYLKKY